MLHTQFRRLHVCCLLFALGLACDKGEGAKQEENQGPIEAPFALKVHKVEVLDEVAPNETYLKNGLGIKAGDGKTFVCVQYEVTNEGGAEARTAGAEGRLKVKVSALPLPHVVGPTGTQTEVSVQAAGSYQPADWKADSGDVEPGKTAKKSNCFAVAQGETDGLKMVLAGKIDRRPWNVEAALPPAA